jgi:hypothetical protein
MKCFTSILMLTILLFVSLAAFGQDKQGPDLETTVEFMNTVSTPDHRLISLARLNTKTPTASRCALEVIDNQRINFLLPDGTKHETDQYGIVHSSFTWAIIRGPEALHFDLKDVEPISIKSHGGFSQEFLKQHNPVGASDVNNPDLTDVMFRTTDSKKSVENGEMKDDEDTLEDTVVFRRIYYSSGGSFVFGSKDRAERFITAFLHAVALCGGKDSYFQPTPR